MHRVAGVSRLLVVRNQHGDLPRLQYHCCRATLGAFTWQVWCEQSTFNADHLSTVVTKQNSLRKAIKQAPDLRLMHLEEREAAESAAHNRDASKITQRIIRAEASSTNFNTLRRVLGKNQKCTGTGSLIRANH
jgi:hypothetical protein